jgi:bacterioferritin-associated ferredoxin
VIVCHCRVVSDRDVARAVGEGARSLASVCKKTGAAQDCATCIFTVKALVCQHQEAADALLEVEGAAS